MVTAIDPMSIKRSGSTVAPAPASQDFSVFMGALAPAGGETGRQLESSNAGAVTQAAMTGLSGASAPYYSGGPTVGVASGPMAGIAAYDIGGAVNGSTFGTPAATTGGATGTATGVPFTNPSQDFMEKDYLLREMNDASLNMLILQAQVQNQARYWTTVSNVIQSRDRTLSNLIQNIRVA